MFHRLHALYKRYQSQYLFSKMGNMCCNDQPPKRANIVSNKLSKETKLTKEPSKQSQPTDNVKTPDNDDSPLIQKYKSSDECVRRPKLSRSASQRRVRQKTSEDDFQKTCSLGKGSFGQVYLVKHKQNSANSEEQFAMKMIPKSLFNENLSVHSLSLQKHIMTHNNSNFIIDLKYSFQSRNHYFLVMEFAPGGDLYSFLHNKQQPGKVQMWKSKKQEAPRFVMACVVLALETLHDNAFMYRDLKPENVVIFSDGYAKLTDFGLAQRQEEHEFSTDLVGTRIYMAPEIVADQIYKKTVDLWALGILLYEMIFLEPPYEHKTIVGTKFKKKCRRDEKERKWKWQISPEAKDLINNLLKVDPQSRIGAKSFMDIKRHPFFKDFDWEKLAKMQLVSPLKDIVNQYKQVSPKKSAQKGPLTDIDEHASEFACSHTHLEDSETREHFPEFPNLKQ